MKKKIREAHRRAAQAVGQLSRAIVRSGVSMAALSDMSFKLRSAAELLDQAMEDKKNDR